jgi:ATP-dependent Clp protease, protease subunit
MLQVKAKTSEILIYDVIGQDWFGGGISAASVIAALDQMDGRRVTVRINSPGGVADEGIAIYHALKRYEGGVDTVVDSLAASAASVIALAGEQRLTSVGARWMIHRAMAMSVGNAEDMRKAASTLETYDQSLIEIYKQYMAMDDDEIMGLLSAETWYKADEAITVGLSTGKAGESDAEPMVAAWFKNPPAALVSNRVLAPKPVAHVGHARGLKFGMR